MAYMTREFSEVAFKILPNRTVASRLEYEATLVLLYTRPYAMGLHLTLQSSSTIAREGLNQDV